jgi:3-hydroxyisobutyrate dehydrogenase
MARRIVDAGFPVTLWARRPESLEPYADTGVAFAATLPELGAASDLLFVCVVDDAGVDEVLRGDGGALAGMSAAGVVAVHSTVHPHTMSRLQEDFPDLAFVDAPVSGGGLRAAAGELLLMAGGPDGAVEQCRPVFETYAGRVVHLGPLGVAQQAKLLNNALFTAQLGLVADVYAIAERHDMDVTALAAVLADGSGRCFAADVLSNAGHRLEAMAAHAGPLLAKDIDILAEMLSPAGAPFIGAEHIGAGLIGAADRALVGMGIDRAHGAPAGKGELTDD